MGSKRKDRHLRAVPAPEETAESVIREALQSDHPFELLDFVGGALEPVLRGEPPEGLFEDDDEVTVESIVSGLMLMDSREITAALYVYAALLEGTSLATEIAAELGRRDWELPQCVRELGDITIEETMSAPDPAGNGDWVLVSLRWPSGLPLTIVMTVDFNGGNVATDGFLAPDDMAGVTDALLEDIESLPAPQPLAPEEARARIEEALANADRTKFSLESEAWPAARPVVEWVAGRPPPGGKGYGPANWSVADEMALIDAFLTSEWGQPIADLPNTVGVLDAMIGCAVGSGHGDPLRWSPESVLVALSMRLPRMLADHPEYLARVPEVMRQFIRYSHAQRGLCADFTEETLTALDDGVRDNDAEGPQQASFDFAGPPARRTTADRIGGWAFAWFPKDQWGEARARFQLTAMPVDHAAYSRVIEGRIRETSQSIKQPLSVAPLNVDELLEYARSHDMNPNSDKVRPALAAEMARTGKTNRLATGTQPTLLVQFRSQVQAMLLAEELAGHALSAPGCGHDAIVSCFGRSIKSARV